MHAVRFFESQFQRQVGAGDFELNPFEGMALGQLRGTVLDLGCGLGNLALEAGRRGHEVVAVDASPTAVARIRSAAAAEGLRVRAEQADIASWRIDRTYDSIVAIGLLMFFRRERALELLKDIQDHVVPGGRAVINVLVEGTTYMDMFDAEEHCLFGRDELVAAFSTWRIVDSRADAFPAPGRKLKAFATVVAERPDEP